jgi:methionyl-tRNA synthetase
MAKRFYVTTPIYYVNDVPHLGTAYTTVIADALRRYHQLAGEETYFLTGTDEHGQKIERVAAEQKMEPKAFCDQISERFREAWPKLDVVTDRFIRTTDADHEAWVKELWKKIEAAGDLYVDNYEDWYCVGCEGYKTEKELEQPGNLCPIHKKAVERVKEETYFFRLSKYEERLKAFYASHPDFIQPESRRNEVLAFVEGGLKDLSCSRTSFTWGIPVPGNEKHVMYVWFDALSNYRSALGSGDLTRFWAPNAKVVHMVGKDILRFHAIFWPAFLMAAGYKDSELPSVVYAHGFLTIDGHKMSKSLRNAVDPIRLAQELGADVLRYQLLRAISFGLDGDFDHAAMLERYNADLGKNLGNLLARTLGLCVKFTEGKTPAFGEKTPLEDELIAGFEREVGNARAAWEEIAPHRALEATMALSSLANGYVDRAAPWALAKNGDTARLGTVLASLLEVLRALSVLIWPAMPKKSDEMRAQLGLPALVPTVDSDLFPSKFEPRPAGQALAPSTPLFPTYDKDQVAALLDKLAPKPEAPAPTAASKTAAPPPTLKEGGQATPAAGGAEAAATGGPPEINYAQFEAVDLRVGIVATAEKVPKKDKLLRLTVDLGEATPRNIIAGLALSFTPESLVGKRVVVVANLAPRDFGKGMVSHGMLLATGPSEALTLATVPGDVPAGARLK